MKRPRTFNPNAGEFGECEMTDHALKQNDFVRIKGMTDCPQMMCNGDPYRRDGQEDILDVDVIWFDQHDRLQRETFACDCMEKWE